MGEADATLPVGGALDAGGSAEEQVLRPIDVLLPARQGWERVSYFIAQWYALVVMGLVLVLYWFVGASRLNAPMSSPVGPILFGVGVLFVLFMLLRRDTRAAKRKRSAQGKRSALKAALCAEPQASLRELLAAGSPLDGLLAGARDEAELVDAFKEMPFTGAALRMSSRAHRLWGEIEPLNVPFEPTLLNRAYARLLQARPDSKDRLIEMDFAAWAKAARQVGLILRGSGIMGGFGAWMLSRMIRFAMTGRGSGLDLIFAILLVVCPVVFVITQRVAGHLYLIPGGLIDVRRKKIYRRSTELMIWCPDTCVLNVLTVDTGSHLSFTMTPSEAELALRAWLSPVPGPSDELIESFLKGRS